MSKLISLFILVLVCTLLVACSNQPAESGVEVQVADQSTVASQARDTPASVPPTETSIPTNTPIPATDTPSPTDTPIPPTDTPTPTNTPIPPIDTPTPTNTPIPPTPTKSAVDFLEQAQVYFQEENWEAAIKQTQAALELQPDLGPAYRILGFSSINLDQLENGAAALNKYLELVPEAADRAEVETGLQQLEGALVSKQFGVDIPPGKALFVFINYSGDQWNVDFGPYFLEVPPKPVDQDIFFVAQIIEPGSYTWMAATPSGGARAIDADGHTAFDFTVAAGETKIACVGGGSREIQDISVDYYGGFSYGVDDQSHRGVSLC